MHARARPPARTHRLVHLVQILLMSQAQLFLDDKLLFFNTHRSVQVTFALVLANTNQILHLALD